MNKRYYWLKLKEDFFQQKYMKKLRKIAGGEIFTIIYLKMLLLSIHNNGYISFDHLENTFPEELALSIDEAAENIAITLRFLMDHGLVEYSDNLDEYFLTATKECLGSETQGAARQRRYRDKSKALQSDDTVTHLSHGGDKNVTAEKEQQQRQQKDLENNNIKLLPEHLQHISSILVSNGIKAPMLDKILAMPDVPDVVVVSRLATEAQKKDNPSGWLVAALLHQWELPKPKNERFDPACPKCHGTGKEIFYVHDTGQKIEVPCDCWKKYK
jgi:predicted phage replisome organizer